MSSVSADQFKLKSSKKIVDIPKNVLLDHLPKARPSISTKLQTSLGYKGRGIKIGLKISGHYNKILV
jgi:hypothetical protein